MSRHLTTQRDPAADDYQARREEFSWDIPEHFNIGVDVCDKWAVKEPDRPALIHQRSDASVEVVTFGELMTQSNRAANCLKACGVVPGDRVAILLAQSPEAAFMHIAVYKAGAVAVPLFVLFGFEALEFRLRHSGARVLVTDREGARKIEPILGRLPELTTVLVSGNGAELPDRMLSLEEALGNERPDFEAVRTRAEDPALIIYTSGTTGKPKGALHAHRVLLGHLPGVEMSHGGGIHGNDVFWTPADWAWIGGLLDVLLPALHHGACVVAHRFAKFDAAAAFALMSRHRVTSVFLPPTALKMLRAEPAPKARWPLALRSVASGGESLGQEMLAWGREALGVQINEFYGQTECNMTVSSCAVWFAANPGFIGKAVPGHQVAIVDDRGRDLGIDREGHIAVRSPDPVMFLGYWKDSQATAEKFAGGYLLTGDQGCMDNAGFVRFVGRSDDVITSAGYRIGPGPIEDCLLGHPAVRMAAVVGVPDDERTEIVKAFVVLAEGFSGDEALVRVLQAHVRSRLSAHEYPRQVAFVDSMPLTATGKVIRKELRARSQPAHHL